MDQRGHIKAFLKSIGAKQIKHRTGWVIAACPLAPWRHQGGVDKSPSFGVRSDGSKAHCFSCQYSGDLWELLFELKRQGVTGLAKARETLEALDEALPEIVEDAEPKPDPGLAAFDEEWLESFPPVWNFQRGRGYLKQRGVVQTFAEKLDLRFDPLHGDRVCFPVRDFEGVLRGLHGRTTRNDVSPKYFMYTPGSKSNPVVWLGEAWVDMDKPVVLVESVFDLLAVLPVYSNAMCSLFAGLTKAKVQRISGCLNIVTLYDADKAGDNARKAISKWLPDSIVWHARPTEEEGDPGNMTQERIEEVLSEFWQ